MKKLSIFFIKSFVGPFIATTLVSMFMLVMQFLWKYIDDLMGKGIEIAVILELLFYVSASLLPLALPLAILLSSLMVMGNLGEHNELTALKSSGLSIYRILRPLTGVILLISLGTFYFANYVIPVANYKWHAIIWEIQQTKLTTFLQPGVYTQDIDGFSIKIKDKKDNKFWDIIIHDRRKKDNQLKTIVADSGLVFQSSDGSHLFFKLFHGNVIEESRVAQTVEDNISASDRKVFPSRKVHFKNATYKMEMKGFKMQDANDNLFKDSYEMLNVFQIDDVTDSLQREYTHLKRTLSYNNLTKHLYYQSSNFSTIMKNDSLQVKMMSQAHKTNRKLINKDTVSENKAIVPSELPPPIYNLEEMSPDVRAITINDLELRLRQNIRNIDSQQKVIDSKANSFRRYEIEFYRKLALPFSIIILFFIGAPLGAIVKRGGFGAPVVTAALLFMIYYVLITIGNEMAFGKVLPPFWGIFGPSFLLIPAAIILMIAAGHDGNFGFLKNKFKRKK